MTARERVEQVIAGLGPVRTTDRIVLDKAPLLDAIASALADAERGVWEQAAKIVEGGSYLHELAPDYLWGKMMAKRFRKKAQAGEGA